MVRRCGVSERRNGYLSVAASFGSRVVLWVINRQNEACTLRWCKWRQVDGAGGVKTKRRDYSAQGAQYRAPGLKMWPTRSTKEEKFLRSLGGRIASEGVQSAACGGAAVAMRWRGAYGKCDSEEGAAGEERRCGEGLEWCNLKGEEKAVGRSW